MKKIFVFVFVVFVSATCFCGEVTEELLDAIEQVESNCNPNAIGDKGNAVGSFQIWKIYVKDVNRILDLNNVKRKYTYEDRYSRKKSREMVRIYLEHYGKRYEKLTGKEATEEIYSRIHNGGVNGWKKRVTIPYWGKVKKHLTGYKNKS